ncbi:hypothetical protein MNAN1_003370 [Malassezia nana]|uniref:Exonuclease V n=1 Tax=Malassezia nana TaxID=180528 RepID=A0AAF0J8S8_9BASI|nr:hypothetical protein MNAN1_003370 [Malassezia nana]
MQKTYLGVSEVVSPAWCEYAYLYNLLFQSHLPLSMRPLSITTPRGTILEPNWTLAEQKEQVLEQGTAVHEDIERDVLPVQVTLRVETREDEWALLLLQFATGLYILHTRGRTREVPVFGIMHGKLIRGIIDELHLDAHGDIVLVETKTRSSTTIPLQMDQQPAHWQCMLYRRLLVNLAATWQCTMDNGASPLDLSVIWETFQIRPNVPLTTSFICDVNKMIRHVDTPWESGQWSSQLTLQHVVDLLKLPLRACQRRMAPIMDIVYVKRDTAEILDSVSLSNNPTALDTFLKTTFALLDGKREPEGVAICSTNRCERCIWREKCEWRQDMAKAAQKRKGERARQSDDHHLWAEFDEKDLLDLDW